MLCLSHLSQVGMVLSFSVGLKLISELPEVSCGLSPRWNSLPLLQIQEVHQRALAHVRLSANSIKPGTAHSSLSSLHAAQCHNPHLVDEKAIDESSLPR